ncbi:MAG: hypothetical protein JW787_01795 [Sedimentisphaerales bacterium]|nr:hypothetical protein [Sedimentisphaerales bacterium]
MFRKKAVQAVLIVLYLSISQSYAETIELNLRIRNDKNDEKIINRASLTTIKEFIIKNGLRETYSQMFNNNPAYHSKQFAFYLNPDTGQANINCELDKSDFQTLVIRDSQRKNQYCYIEFTDKNVINVSIPHPSEDLTISQIRDFASQAIEEILIEINKNKPVLKSTPVITTNTTNLLEAINLAIPALKKDVLANKTEYILTAVQQNIRGGKYIWRVTFKPKELVPDDPSEGPHTLGGEVFVNVDLGTKSTVITYGE